MKTASGVDSNKRHSFQVWFSFIVQPPASSTCHARLVQIRKATIRLSAARRRSREEQEEQGGAGRSRRSREEQRNETCAPPSRSQREAPPLPMETPDRRLSWRCYRLPLSVWLTLIPSMSPGGQRSDWKPWDVVPGLSTGFQLKPLSANIFF